MWESEDSQEVGLEAAILERVRNSSLVEHSCAENVTGLKVPTEAMGMMREHRTVGERTASGEAVPEGAVEFAVVRMLA